MKNNNKLIPKPLREIEEHPSMKFWGGILVIFIDYLTTTPEENTATMTSLFKILPDYAHWAQLVKIAIRTAIPDTIPYKNYRMHIADMKFIIEQLNDFQELEDVRMRLLIPQWNFERLKLGAALFGLRDIRWGLGYVVKGRGYVEITERSNCMARLLRVYQVDFQGALTRSQLEIQRRKEIQRCTEIRHRVDIQRSKSTQPNSGTQTESDLKLHLQRRARVPMCLGVNLKGLRK
ncbi:hypothetical protein NHQ30_009695 [Ciborinia camelliae]|nr:hypothetical protein NHQ30_009695 [Ciborinia camelliae]